MLNKKNNTKVAMLKPLTMALLSSSFLLSSCVGGNGTASPIKNNSVSKGNPSTKNINSINTEANYATDDFQLTASIIGIGSVIPEVGGAFSITQTVLGSIIPGLMDDNSFDELAAINSKLDDIQNKLVVEDYKIDKILTKIDAANQANVQQFLSMYSTDAGGLWNGFYSYVNSTSPTNQNLIDLINDKKTEEGLMHMMDSSYMLKLYSAANMLSGGDQPNTPNLLKLVSSSVPRPQISLVDNVKLLFDADFAVLTDKINNSQINKDNYATELDNYNKALLSQYDIFSAVLQQIHAIETAALYLHYFADQGNLISLQEPGIVYNAGKGNELENYKYNLEQLDKVFKGRMQHLQNLFISSLVTDLNNSSKKASDVLTFLPSGNWKQDCSIYVWSGMAKINSTKPFNLGFDGNYFSAKCFNTVYTLNYDQTCDPNNGVHYEPNIDPHLTCSDYSITSSVADATHWDDNNGVVHKGDEAGVSALILHSSDNEQLPKFIGQWTPDDGISWGYHSEDNSWQAVYGEINKYGIGKRVETRGLQKAYFNYYNFDTRTLVAFAFLYNGLEKADGGGELGRSSISYDVDAQLKCLDGDPHCKELNHQSANGKGVSIGGNSDICIDHDKLQLEIVQPYDSNLNMHIAVTKNGCGVASSPSTWCTIRNGKVFCGG